MPLEGGRTFPQVTSGEAACAGYPTTAVTSAVATTAIPRRTLGVLHGLQSCEMQATCCVTTANGVTSPEPAWPDRHPETPDAPGKNRTCARGLGSSCPSAQPCGTP